MAKTIQKNETVVLMDEKGNRILLQINDGIRKIKARIKYTYQSRLMASFRNFGQAVIRHLFMYLADYYQNKKLILIN